MNGEGRTDTRAASDRGGPTIGAALKSAAARLRGAGVETPRLDAEVLLADLLGVDRWRLMTDAGEWLPSAALPVFEGRVARRAAREPVAYILGHKEFWSLDLNVTADVLIPRPETECLVEAAVRWLRNRRPEARRPDAPGARGEPTSPRSPSSGPPPPVVVDVGTGPGTVVLAVASEVEGPRYIGTDISPAALAVARWNAEGLGLAARVELAQGDLCEPLGALGLEGRVDLLVSNPPYVAVPDMRRLAPEIRRYEPAVALEGGPDGLSAIRRLVAEAPRWLRPGGALIFEFGDGQADACLALLREGGAFGPGRIVHDLGGWPRGVLAPRPPQGPEGA